LPFTSAPTRTASQCRFVQPPRLWSLSLHLGPLVVFSPNSSDCFFRDPRPPVGSFSSRFLRERGHLVSYFPVFILRFVDCLLHNPFPHHLILFGTPSLDTPTPPVWVDRLPLLEAGFSTYHHRLNCPAPPSWSLSPLLLVPLLFFPPFETPVFLAIFVYFFWPPVSFAQKEMAPVS